MKYLPQHCGLKNINPISGLPPATTVNHRKSTGFLLSLIPVSGIPQRFLSIAHCCPLQPQSIVVVFDFWKPSRFFLHSDLSFFGKNSLPLSYLLLLSHSRCYILFPFLIPLLMMVISQPPPPRRSHVLWISGVTGDKKGLLSCHRQIYGNCTIPFCREICCLLRASSLPVVK